MQRDLAAVADIAAAALLIMEFTRGLDGERFFADRKTQSAVIAGMRDKLIHEYDDVDLEEVWRTVERDIPSLLNAVKPLLPDR